MLSENAMFDFAPMGMSIGTQILTAIHFRKASSIRRAASSLPAVFAVAFGAHARGDLVSMDAFPPWH